MTGDVLDLLIVFIRMGLLAFRGLQSVLPEIQREVVEIHHWMSPSDFLEAYALGQIAPGPNMLVSFIIGYRVAGVPGAFAAGLGMFIPTMILAAVIGNFWYRLSDNPWVGAAQKGLAPVALGLMYAGVLTIGQLGIHDFRGIGIAVVACALLLTRKFSPVAVIGLASVFGFFVA